MLLLLKFILSLKDRQVMKDKQNSIVITTAIRTAIGTFRGSLKNIQADELGSAVVKAAIKKSNLNSNDIDELIEFIEKLPNDLRVEVSFFVFEKTFRQIEFFKGKPLTFIAWICPLLKPIINNLFI